MCPLCRIFQNAAGRLWLMVSIHLVGTGTINLCSIPLYLMPHLCLANNINNISLRREIIHRYTVQTCMDISACRHMCVYTSHIYMSTIKVLCEDCKHGGDEEKDGDGAHDGVE